MLKIVIIPVYFYIIGQGRIYRGGGAGGGEWGDGIGGPPTLSFSDL